MSRVILAAALALGLGTVSYAHDYSVGDLTIEHPVAFATTANARAGGGFMTITNNGTQTDRLIAAEGDYPRIEIHESIMEGDVAKMQEVEGLEIPPGGTITLMPGGMHVMFMGLKAPFVLGETVDVTLVFENAGRVDISFNIEERPARAGMDHGSMDHSDH